MTREDTDVSYVPWRRMTHAVPDVSFETHGTIGSTSVIISRPTMTYLDRPVSYGDE